MKIFTVVALSMILAVQALQTYLTYRTFQALQVTKHQAADKQDPICGNPHASALEQLAAGCK